MTAVNNASQTRAAGTNRHPATGNNVSGTIIGLGDGRIQIGTAVHSNIGVLFLSGTATLVGDFTGININSTGTINLGNSTQPLRSFIVSNDVNTQTNIHAREINVNISQGFEMINVSVASTHGMHFSSFNTDTNHVRMNARFYASTNITGTLSAHTWDTSMIPQFYTRSNIGDTSGQSGTPLRMVSTSNGEMGAAFFTDGSGRIIVDIQNGGNTFNGLFYGHTIDIRGNTHITFDPIIPPYGLDEDLEAYLRGRGWSLLTPEEQEALSVPVPPFIPNITFTQGRSMNFAADAGAGAGASASLLYATMINDNLTRRTAAVVNNVFLGTFNGNNMTISNVNLGAALPSGYINFDRVGLFAQVGMDAYHDQAHPGGAVTGVTLVNSNIRATHAVNANNVGGIAGVNRGTVEGSMTNVVSGGTTVIYGTGVVVGFLIPASLSRKRMKILKRIRSFSRRKGSKDAHKK
jgi:hypothetical protein